MSVFDPYLRLPEQQALIEGGGPGSDPDQGAHGGGDQGDGGEGGVQGGRGTNPGRGYGGDAAQPGGRGQDEGWDAPGGSWGGSGADPSVTAFAHRHGIDVKDVVGTRVNKRGQLVARVKGVSDDTLMTASGTKGIGLPSIAGAIAMGLGELFGHEYDMADGMPAPDFSRSEIDPEGRDGQGGNEHVPGSEHEPGSEDEETEEQSPEETDEEYRTRLREALERLLGDMPGGEYDVPDWKVALSLDVPPGRRPVEAPAGSMRMARERAAYDRFLGMLDEAEGR